MTLPDDADAWVRRGEELRQAGDIEAAASCYRRAVELRPELADAHNNLGGLQLALGKPADALTSFRRALAVRPDFAMAHCNAGNALRDLGNRSEAEASYRRALAVDPRHAGAHCNLANLLSESGRYSEAEPGYRRALQLAPDFALAHINLGSALFAMGRYAEAEQVLRHALRLAPGDVNAQTLHSRALARQVPEWHVPMINDTARNDAYEQALRAAVTPGSTVLEIGTGSGLLAMMAARLGATVVTCEAVPLIAETAKEIVARNGLESRIRVVAKKSTELQIGADLPQRADLLVSEIFSSELLGEGVLPSIEDARRRLLKPGARIVPPRASAVCALFGGAGIGKNVFVEDVSGFDLRPFNAIVSARRQMHRSDVGMDLVSDEAEPFAFDFTADMYYAPAARTVRLPIRKAATCYGVVQWIRLHMTDRLVFENHPQTPSPASGWQHCLYRFPQPLEVYPGQAAVIRAAHDRSSLWFFLERLEH